MERGAPRLGRGAPTTAGWGHFEAPNPATSSRFVRRPGRGQPAVERPAALQKAPVLGAEALETFLADSVGKANAPPAPRRHTAQQRVPTIALMPRASADQHGVLLDDRVTARTTEGGLQGVCLARSRARATI